MADIWRSALDEQLPVLQQNLLLNDYFYGHLIQKRIVTQDTIEEIKSESSSDGRILKLVGFLKKRNDECFENFLSILESTDNRFIKEIIDQAIRSNLLRRQRENAKSSELLKLKHRHIQELEQELSDLTKRSAEAEKVARMEMDRSKYYLEVINSLTAVRSFSTQSISIDDRESELEEMEVEIESLKDQVERLETSLQKRTQDLDKTKRQLITITESEKKFKRNLGLQEDADEIEVMARIQEMKRSQAELKTMQNELDRISEMKDAYVEKIRKLTQEVTRMDADRRRKDLQLQRIKRNKEDNHILQNARCILKENKPNTNHQIEQRVFEEMNLPRIDIGTRLPSARNRTINQKLSSAQLRPQCLLPQPNSTARGNQHNASNEPRYCVLCRMEHYVGEACRIHTAAKRDGRYSCCKAAETGARTMGCRTLHSHLYVQVTGVDKECRFYDQQGRLLCFKKNEGEEEEERVNFLSVR